MGKFSGMDYCLFNLEIDEFINTTPSSHRYRCRNDDAEEAGT